MKLQKITLLVIVMAVVLACGILPRPSVEQPAKTPSVVATGGLTPVITGVQVATLVASATPTSTATEENQKPSVDIPTPTPVASATIMPTPRPPYGIQPGTPLGLQNFQDSGCNWMGVGGQVFGANEAPLAGLVIEIGGSLNNQPVSLLGLTGTTTLLGNQSYLIQLASQPIASNGSLWIQLKDQGGNSLSNQASFPTYANCERNLVLVNFTSTVITFPRIYLPIITK